MNQEHAGFSELNFNDSQQTARAIQSEQEVCNPRIVSARWLHGAINEQDIFIVDARGEAQSVANRIPGAVGIDTARLYRSDGKAEGLMPHPGDLAEILSATGIQRKHHVVVYDDETGVDATRLLWLLDAFGHERSSLLSGGVDAWQRARFAVSEHLSTPVASLYPVCHYRTGINLDKQEVLEAIDSDRVIIDTRSLPEYNGLDLRADRGGRIPGAVHIAWDDLIDYYDTGEVLPAEETEKLLLDNGVRRDQKIIVYCQTNRRSAHTYLVLRSLGYDVSTYAGSWSEWGNDPSLPVEI